MAGKSADIALDFDREKNGCQLNIGKKKTTIILKSTAPSRDSVLVSNSVTTRIWHTCAQMTWKLAKLGHFGQISEKNVLRNVEEGLWNPSW